MKKVPRVKSRLVVRDQPPLAISGGATLMSLWPPRREDQAKSERSLGAHVQRGRSGRQTKSGASGSEPLVAGEHVPDRVREPAGDVDLGDLGAALLAEPALRALVARRVDGVAEGLHRRLDQRPAQIGRPVL